jgi:hypothetical protein
VLENVGKIAGMKRVIVVHGRTALSAAHGRHHDVIPAAGIPGHSGAIAKA